MPRRINGTDGDMGRRSSRQTAVVADRRPLERGLARFLLEERGLHVVGGTIPAEDADELKQRGVAEVFTPGAPTSEIVDFLKGRVAA